MNLIFNSWNQYNNAIDDFLDRSITKVAARLPHEWEQTLSVIYRPAIKTALIGIGILCLIQLTALNPLLYLIGDPAVRIGLQLLGGAISLGFSPTKALFNNLVGHIKHCCERWDFAAKITAAALVIFTTACCGGVIYLAPSWAMLAIGATVLSNLLLTSVIDYFTFDFKAHDLFLLEQIRQVRAKSQSLEQIKANILKFIAGSQTLRPLFQEKLPKYQEFFYLAPQGIARYKDSDNLYDQRAYEVNKLSQLQMELQQFYTFLQSEPELFRKFEEEMRRSPNKSIPTSCQSSKFIFQT